MEGQASLTPGSGGSRGDPMSMCSPGGLLPSVGSMSSSQPSLLSPPPEVPTLSCMPASCPVQLRMRGPAHTTADVAVPACLYTLECAALRDANHIGLL